ncbi:ATP-binding cassette sub-family G member 1 [Blattella germanica]|nr:ATP-binding cassette sub-family G member 1 [Blattella germanica]
MVTIYGDRKHLNCDELYCHFRSPSKVLEEFQMQNARFEVDCLAVALWIIIFQVVFYCVLKWRVHNSQ